jgi:outer membrane protein OmpA-like peptidoglycan-associated protein
VATNLQYARKVDYEKSSFWALSSLGSSGVIVAGVQLFHLVNRETHRGHRFEVWTGGVGVAPIITGSIGTSDYVSFETPEPKNFLDFDGTHATIRETNAGVYSWTTVSLWGMSVVIADGGFNVPGLGVSHGTINIMFGDGQTLGVADLQNKPPSSEVSRSNRVVKHYGPADVYQIQGDLLFPFNKHFLRPGKRTEEALVKMSFALLNATDTYYLVLGHTDSIGDREYNFRLSKRRADTVVKWFKQNTRVEPHRLKAVGMGMTEPIETNAAEWGRQRNRRVEVVALPKKAWDAWSDRP